MSGDVPLTEMVGNKYVEVSFKGGLYGLLRGSFVNNGFVNENDDCDDVIAGGGMIEDIMEVCVASPHPPLPLPPPPPTPPFCVLCVRP